MSINAQSTLELKSNNIDQIVNAMTLDEKVRLVLGGGDKDVWRYYKTTGEIFIKGQAGATRSIERLGIGNAILTDGPAGLRIDTVQEGLKQLTFCTAFPAATALASSWNLDLVTKVGEAIGNETLEYGSDVLLGPGMNIQRNPLTGRNFEYYSEDPYITGEMAAAMVNGIQSNNIGACIKHFAANNIETNRRTINEIISQRALREIYLRGFEIALKKSKPWMIMTSYNKINGIYTSENKDLLQTILRDEWKYNGLVTTDWVSGLDFVAQMRAGNELLMPGYYQTNMLTEAVKRGELDESVLNRNVKRILEFIVKTSGFNKYKCSNQPDLTKHALISKEAAVEGMVLLKNEKNSLPLKNIKKLALFGKTSYHFIAGGTGSGAVNNKYTVSLLEGLENSNFKISSSLSNYYRNYNDSLIKDTKPDNRTLTKNIIDFAPEPSISRSIIQQSVKESEMAIITIGRNAGEQWDRKEDGYFNLSASELLLIKNVSELFHAANKNVIVVLNIGGPIEIASWRNQPDAILLAWQTGQEGGNALTDILSGKVNPSGKLAVTFPMKYVDVPSASSFPGVPAENPVDAFYEDGIYVGYRYYDTFKVDPAYEFGYGISYTNFSYSPVTIITKESDGKVGISVIVKNQGKTAGKEIVQLYLSAPTPLVEKPIQELKGFAKTKLLKPGESETIHFKIDAFDLASFNSGKSQWIADKGVYEVRIGASSRDIRSKTNFTLDNPIMVEQVHDVLYPNIRMSEISTKGAHKIIKLSDLILPF